MLVVIAFAGLLGLTILLGLKSPTVRGAILKWAGSAVERSTGVQVTARDFQLSLRSGDIGLEEVELRAGDSKTQPFLAAAEVGAELSWRSLLSERPQIRAIRVRDPELDLGAPLPQREATADTPADTRWPALDVHRVEIFGAGIRSGAVPKQLDDWLASWRASGVTLAGSLVDGTLALEIRQARLAVESHRRPLIAFDLSARASAEEGGGFSIQDLELIGNALQLYLEGRGRLEPNVAVDLALDLRADLAGLVPDLTGAGQIEANGELSVTAAPATTLVGDLRIFGRDFPAELLQPLLVSADREELDLAGTQLDVSADVTSRLTLAELRNDPGRDLVQGQVRVTWRREERRLVVASVQTLEPEEPDGGPGIAVGFDAAILPDAEGSRSLSGQTFLAGWRELESLELRDVRLEIEQDNLEELMAELGLSKGAIGGFQPAGSLSLVVTLDGPVASPDLEARGSWRLRDRPLVELSARSGSLSSVTFKLEALADSPGTRRLEGEWTFPGLEGLRQGSFRQTRLEIDLPDLAGTLARVEELLEVFLPNSARRQELLAALSPSLRDRVVGSLSADVRIEGPIRSPKIDLTAEWVPADFGHLLLVAAYEEPSLTLQQLSGVLQGALPGGRTLDFAARGRVGIEKPIRDAALELEIFDPVADVRRLDVQAWLDGGTLTLETSAPSVPGAIEATVPLAVLRDLSPASDRLSDLPLIFDTGPLEVSISGLGLSRGSEIAFVLADFEAPNLEIEGVLDAVVAMDARRPLEATGTLEVAGFRIDWGDNGVESPSNLRVDLGEGRVALPPTRLRVFGPRSEAPLDLRLNADLNPGWQPGEDPRSLINNIDLDLRGTVDSSLSTPFLAGGAASGPVSLVVTASGSLDEPVAELRIEGPEASLVLPGRYRSRITEPEFVVRVDPAGAKVETGRMRLNRGEVSTSGTLDRDGTLQLVAEFEGVRYRLDYGLTVSLDGNLALTWPPEGRRRLSGTVDVERGSLRRNLQLERELIRMLSPSDLAPAESALLESVDLDLNLVTREGVRIKNNLADLRADWDLIRVRGTLAQPALLGTVDIDPGGLVTAYGQTVRIDQGSLTFSGDPAEPPRLDFETTTASEDPRIRSQWDSVWSAGQNTKGPGGGFWDRYDPQRSANTFQADEFATGLTSYFQNRFLQSVTGGAPVVELSVQPLPLMGETDTTARVTMSYHLTPQISYVLSQNPREAEGRTDILNLQNFALAPSLRGQLFRNDQGNQGVTLQQMLEFGGGRRAQGTMPRLRSIDLAEPRAVSKRRIRRATGLRRGQPVAEGADFDIEIDMLDSLARRGFPAAEVDVEIEPLPRNRVNVGIRVEPGTRVEFEFSGDKPQRRARQDIVGLYQPTTLLDSPALETVRRDTARALRARGFVNPQVEVTTERKERENPAGDRIIRVHGEGGRQVNPRSLEFRGVPEDVQSALVALFASRLSRVELAVGEAAADQLFTQSMRTLGYTEPEILSRELSTDGSSLTVEVKTGPRRHLATVEIVGVDAALREALDEVLTLQSGDPLRTGLISATAFRMEDSLRELGFASASVQGRYEPVSDAEAPDFDVVFEVDAGPEHRIGALEAVGLAHSSASWVEKISRLRIGDLLTTSSLTEARRRLARTGIFQRIALRREEPSEAEGGSLFTPITFALEEHPRYRVTYGVRGESTREAGAVVDLSDLNFLGRGQTLGLRLIYATLERNARLYWLIPRVRQSNKTLEFFLEARREESVNVLEDGDDAADVVANIREAWAQITFPWGKRSVHRFYTVYRQSVTENRSVPDESEVRVVNPFSGWQVSYDTGERSFFETSTDRATIFLGSDLSFSSESLGSDYTGYAVFGQIKPQIPLAAIGDSALVWVHNYRGGLKEAKDDVELPFFDRLFAGGEFSVRGYPTNSLGPINEEGVPLGGEAMFVTNQELRFPLWTLLSGVAFFDAGNVWASRQDVDSTLFTSIGAGLRADSPIGPLRLDLAFPLDRREGDPEYKVYFGLGQTF